ncbi:MAG TPA: hypothetical protein VGD69_27060 [Herpetosiphonaceae bacterium]
MRFRRASFTATLIAGLVLSGCGTPDDLTGQLPPRNAVPTPTMVPTASASPSPSGTPSPSDSPAPSPSGTPSPSDSPAPSPSGTPSPSDSPAPSPSGYPAPSGSPTAIPSDSPSPSASPTPSGSPTAIPSDAPVGGHPIAREIADEFGVPVAEVEGYHSDGIGYGILAQFYSIANNRCGATASYTVDQLVAMKQSGMGMGEIRKQALGSASAKECSLGRLKQGDLDAADAQVPPGQAKKAETSAPGQEKKAETSAPAQKPAKDKPASPAQPAKKPTTPKPAKPKPAAPAKPSKPAPQPKPAPKDNGGGKGKK